MSIVLAIGLGIAASEPALPPIEHHSRVEHAGQTVDAHYRTHVALVSRQVGAVSKVGTASTLRCAWRADVRIDRRARSGGDRQFTRSIERSGILEGTRPGWCGTHRNAISQELAQRTAELRDQLLALARDDEAVLKAEIERAVTNREG